MRVTNRGSCTYFLLCTNKKKSCLKIHQVVSFFCFLTGFVIIDEEGLDSLLFSNSYYHVFGVCCEQTGISCLSVLHSILYIFFWLLIDRSITKNSVPCVEIRLNYLLLLVVVVQCTIMLPADGIFWERARYSSLLLLRPISSLFS